MITLAQYCLKGAGYDLSYHAAGTWMAYELLRFGLGRLIVDWENPF